MVGGHQRRTSTSTAQSSSQPVVPRTTTSGSGSAAAAVAAVSSTEQPVAASALRRRSTLRPASPSGTFSGPPIQAQALVTASAASVASDQRPIIHAQASVDPVTGFFQSLNAFFNNQTPTLNPHQTGQKSSGVITGELGAVDPDSPTLTYSIIKEPVHGTVHIDQASGIYTYTPDATWAHLTGGPDTFTVSVSDAASGFAIHGLPGLLHLLTFGLIGTSGTTSNRTLNVTVTPVNHAPTLTVTTTPNVDGTTTISVVKSDLDGDSVSTTATVANGHGTLTATPGGYTFTPDAAYAHSLITGGSTAPGSDTVTITGTDGHGGTTSSSTAVTITPTNANPTLTVTATPNADGTTTISVVKGDVDGDTVATTTSLAAGHGTVTTAPGGYLFTPDPTYAHSLSSGGSTTPGSDTFTVSATDGYGGSGSTTIVVSITPSNSNPTGGGVTDRSTNSVSGQVSGTIIDVSDLDGDTLSYSVSSAGNGSVTVTANGEFTYTPTANARRDAYLSEATSTDLFDQFSVTVTDGHGGAVVVPVTVAVSPALATYVQGDILRDPSTGYVAIRTSFDESTYPNMAWLVASSSIGATLASTSQVQGWDPLFLVGAVPVTVPISPSVSYPTNSVKWDPQTGDVAIRTIFDESDALFAPKAWLVATPTTGAFFAQSSQVAGWDDLLVPNSSPSILNYTTDAPAANGAVTGQITASDADGDVLAYSAPTSTAHGYIVVTPGSGAFTYYPTAGARENAAQVGADQTDTFTATVTDGFFTSNSPVTVAIDPASAPVAGDIRAEFDGTRRAIYAPNVTAFGDWLGFDPAIGGMWLTADQVDNWVDVALPTTAETPGTGPYSPGDIKIPPNSTAGALTEYAIKTGPTINSTANWFVCSTQNACGSVPDSYVAGWVDVKLPTA
ncbi:Ig-like domain-containing protein [Mycolicibacterium pallens]|uniref:Ig-like domain-containing protein n=1 Tax=Mycolicibacterium pallens TaxID=370524 RepID=UPI000BB8770D|nr:Ig-like domain-containing protein [Mycolicibacterium pallens]